MSILISSDTCARLWAAVTLVTRFWRRHLHTKYFSRFVGCWNSHRTRALVLFMGLFTLSACQAETKMLSAPITGYNHTSAAINRFTVNGAGGPNLGPHLGGGAEVCCSVLPRVWNPDLKAIVEWEKDPNAGASVNWPPLGTDAYREEHRKHAAMYTRHRAVVAIHQYGEKVCALQVHFLPCDQVRVSTTCFTPEHPNYPDKAYFQVKESITCPVL